MRLALVILAVVSLSCKGKPDDPDAGLTRTAGPMDVREVWVRTNVRTGSHLYMRAENVKLKQVRYYLYSGPYLIDVPPEAPIQ